MMPISYELASHAAARWIAPRLAYAAATLRRFAILFRRCRFSDVFSSSIFAVVSRLRFPSFRFDIIFSSLIDAPPEVLFLFIFIFSASYRDNIITIRLGKRDDF